MKVLFLWVVLSGISAAIAKGGGRRPLLWGFISILFSPFIVIPVLIILRFKNREKAGPANDEDLSSSKDIAKSVITPTVMYSGGSVYEIKDGMYRLNLQPLESVEDLKSYKKEVQLALKALRQAMKENNQEMASIRANASLGRAKGTRGGVGLLFNTLNSISRDSKVEPLQEIKEKIQEMIRKIENHLIDIDQKMS